MTTPLLGLSEIAEGVTNQSTLHNTALRQLEARGFRALSRSTTTPAVGAAEADSYLIPAGATGVWSGKTNQMASWIGGAWAYFTPVEGIGGIWVNDEDIALTFDGTDWVTTGGSILSAPYLDTTAIVKDSGDPTKMVRLEAGGLTTATTRVLTVPDKNGTLAMLDDIATTAATLQPLDADLTALAGLTSAANKGIQFTGAGTAATFDLTTAGKALLDDADAAAQRTTLGLGTAATLASDTDVTLAANSDAVLATQKAVKAYVDAIVTGGAADVMIFKGVIDCSANPNYPAADAGHLYKISVTGKIGGGSGPNVEAGDTIYCITDSTSAGTHASVGANWVISQVNIDGAVVGPASATDGNLAAFDGTTGKLIKHLTPAQVRTLLALVIGTDVQAHDLDLDAIAGLTATTDNFIQSKSGNWASRTVAQVSADLQGNGLLSDAVGFRTIPQNSQSAAYTTVAADAGKHILHPAADTTARTWTIDSNANVAYPVGTAITFVNENAGGVITIAITADTMRLAGAGTTGNRSLAANGIATALKIASTSWIISGTGLT